MVYLHVPIMEMAGYGELLKRAGWKVSKYPLLFTHNTSGFTRVPSDNALVRNVDAWVIAYKGEKLHNNGFLMKHFNKTSPKYHKFIQSGRLADKVTTCTCLT